MRIVGCRPSFVPHAQLPASYSASSLPLTPHRFLLLRQAPASVTALAASMLTIAPTSRPDIASVAAAVQAILMPPQLAPPPPKLALGSEATCEGENEQQPLPLAKRPHTVRENRDHSPISVLLGPTVSACPHRYC